MSLWRTSVPDDVQRTADTVLDVAFDVHRRLGPGFVEPIYQACMAHGMRKRGLRVEREVWLPIEYDGLVLQSAQRVDFRVNGHLLVETKAVQTMLPLFSAQVISYLKASGAPGALLLNFNTQYFREGFTHLVHPSRLPPRVRGFAEFNPPDES